MPTNLITYNARFIGGPLASHPTILLSAPLTYHTTTTNPSPPHRTIYHTYSLITTITISPTTSEALYLYTASSS